jgi:hypothetical protein
MTGPRARDAGVFSRCIEAGYFCDIPSDMCTL